MIIIRVACHNGRGRALRNPTAIRVVVVGIATKRVVRQRIQIIVDMFLLDVIYREASDR